MKDKNLFAREILTLKLNELGGIAFARWLIEVGNGKEKKTVEASEFMERMLNGKLKTDESEYLEKYLKPMREIIEALILLAK